MFFFVGQWQWVSDDLGFAWNAPFPDQLISVIDLRPSGAQAIPGGSPQGFALFVYKTDVSSPGLFRIGTSDLEESITSVKTEIGNRLGFSITSDRIRDLYWELLLDKADVTGGSFSKPLMPNHDGILVLNGVGNVKLNQRSKYWSKVLSAMQKIYEDVRTDSLAGNIEEDLHRRLLGTWRQKFRISPNIFIPNHLPKEEYIRPKTKIIESFDTADSDTLGPDLTWTEVAGDIDVISNEAGINTTSLIPRARADHDLSSDDMYSEMTLTAGTSSNFLIGLGARWSSTADTQYFNYIRHLVAGAAATRKYISGTPTNLDTLVMSASAPITVKSIVNGSHVELYADGVLKISSTDTEIVGFTRAGFGFRAFDTLERGDNFSAADFLRRDVTKSWMGNYNSLPSQGPSIFGLNS